MSPFIFLQTRRIANGVRRSFKTPVRSFMTVLFIAYLVVMMTIPFRGKTPHLAASASMTALDPRVPVAFLTLAHLLLFFYAIPSPKYTFTIFSECDIANIYPAPLRPWQVFRFFLFARSLLGLLLFFAIAAVYGYWFLRLALPGMFPKVDYWSNLVCLFGYVFLVLIALAGFLFWRIALDIRREFDLIGKTTFRNTVGIGLVAFVGFVLVRVGDSLLEGIHFSTALAATLDFVPLQILLAPFGLLAQLLLGSGDLQSPGFWLSIGFWVVLATSGYGALRAQTYHLYEYGLRLASYRTQLAQRMSSPAVLLKEKRDKGKHVLRLPWILKAMDPRRAWAIYWRDMIIAWRSYGVLIRWFRNVLLMVVIAAWIGLIWYNLPLKAASVWKVAGLVMFLIALTLSSTSVMGMAEILRKMETQKPLPINAFHTIAMHILQWTSFVCTITFMPYLLAALLFARYAHIILFVMIAGWSFIHVIISGYFLVALFNPDQQDPIQRMYAGLFGLFAAILVSLPGSIATVVGFLLHAPLAITLCCILLFNLCSTGVVHYLSFKKYRTFVFTE